MPLARYLQKSFALLSTILYFLGQSAAISKSCETPVDLIFLLDGSASIGRDFNRQLTLINHLVEYFGGVSKSVHAAVVVIATRSTVEIRLNDFESQTKFKDAVQKVCIVYFMYKD